MDKGFTKIRCVPNENNECEDRFRNTFQILFENWKVNSGKLESSFQLWKDGVQFPRDIIKMKNGDCEDNSGNCKRASKWHVYTCRALYMRYSNVSWKVGVQFPQDIKTDVTKITTVNCNGVYTRNPKNDAENKTRALESPSLVSAGYFKNGDYEDNSGNCNRAHTWYWKERENRYKTLAEQFP